MTKRQYYYVLCICLGIINAIILAMFDTPGWEKLLYILVSSVGMSLFSTIITNEMYGDEE